MIKSLGDYKLIQCIATDGIISFYHACNRINNTICILKIPAQESQIEPAMTFLHNEYTICSRLDSNSIIRSSRMVRLNNSCCSEFHHYDIEAFALIHDPLEKGLYTFIENAIKMAQIITDLHERGIIHQNLSPAAFYKSASTGNLYCTGFYLASTTSEQTDRRHRPLYYPPNYPYIAPEQTGHIDRAIDERTDLYSLGAVLYKMACGAPPFSDASKASLLYSHVTRKPIPLHVRQIDIPESISEIINKLLEKNPADRYQSAHGVLSDLHTCRRFCASGLVAPTFHPGTRDQITRLLPVKNIHGRDSQLKQLKDALIAADKGQTSAVLISGNPGIGKSKLVETFVSTLDNSLVLFTFGKCDISYINNPYHALKNAIVELIRSILALGNESIAQWRELLTEGCAENRGMIADLIPEVQMIIGPCPHQKIPDDAERGTLFKNVFIAFLQSFLRKDTTLILFIDDLQWADSALADILIPAFFEAHDNRLLFIGVSRTEFDSTNPFRFPSAIQTTILHLDALSTDDSRKMTADMLGLDNDDLGELNTLIYNKTNGNPFFLTTFLEMLITKNLLTHQGATYNGVISPSISICGTWQWNTDAIAQMSCTENVIDIILEKTKRLPAPTLETLTIASCMGIRIDATLVAAVVSRSPQTISEELLDAFNNGILRRETTSGSLNHPQSTVIFFSHDRIREAIYSKIPLAMRSGLHLRIGRTLLQLTHTTGMTVSTYDIVKHFNPYSTDIDNNDDRLKLAHLNKEAAFDARNSHAYHIAMEYLNAAAEFLGNDPSSSDPALFFEIDLRRSECEYLTSCLDAALDRLATLEQRAPDNVQAAHIDLIKMSIFDHQKRPEASLETGFRRLRIMGLHLPQRPSLPFLVTHLASAAFTIPALIKKDNRTGETIQALSEAQLLLCRILSRMWLQSFTIQKQGIVVAITSQLIRSTLQHGICGASSVALCFWGIFIGTITGNPAKGLAYGDRALAIAQQFDDLFSRGITYFLYASFFAHFKGHIDTSLDLLAEGRRSSYEAGDIASASNSAEGYLLFMALSGKKIDDIQRKASETIKFYENVGISMHDMTLPHFIGTWAANIRVALVFDYQEILTSAKRESPLIEGVMLLFSMITATLVEDYHSALHFSAALKRNPLLSPNSYFHYFYVYITAFALSAPGQPVSRSVKRKLHSCRQTLKKAAIHSPINFQHCLLLVAAECYRLDHRNWDALLMYRQAIDTARQHGFIHHAAMACERVALFMKQSNLHEWHTFYTNALSLYFEWGSHAKTDLLKRQVPGIHFNPAGHLAVPGFADIDIQALLKSFEAISEELILDRLLEKLIRIVMENAGAQRGVLLLEHEDTFHVRVEGVLQVSEAHTDTSSAIIPRAVDIPEDKFAIAHSIISFVAMSREPVRLENAAERGRFVHDTYIRNNKIKSVLCVPLSNNDRTRGIIYLENSMIEAAFPQSRLSLIKLLCGQAIISIENALFHDVEIKHLQSKINPHFLFNALSSIAELCHSAPRATEDAIIKLSTLYRYILTAEMRMVSLEEELEIVKKYLDIQKLRFGNRLSFKLDIDGNPARVHMPSMLIQPLVENSIKHGISPRPSGGTLIISVSIRDKDCSIIVEDDGVGPNKSTTGTGYGLESIKKRLRLHYGSDTAVEINDTAGYKVHLRLPV